VPSHGCRVGNFGDQGLGLLAAIYTERVDVIVGVFVLEAVIDGVLEDVIERLAVMEGVREGVPERLAVIEGVREGVPDFEGVREGVGV